ncbi:nestin isoform X2 [Apodemus sylvaticus]|uniref:nestin isoform X2 n=1 Tax=Apodemus sylvaticus TaxID=10129 RepID=UPI0022430C36|nr:nestin isoform X2 [Apodemus sylvaticus]
MNTLSPAPCWNPPLPLGRCCRYSFSPLYRLQGPLPSLVLLVRSPSGGQTSDMESCIGEESFQMWELNRRLEAYLTRVKTLEEQNQLLSAELGGLRAQSGDASWRARADDELAALRVLVDQRWREKHEAEVQRDNLAEELESVAGRCQQVRLARERTVEEAACSRRALEAERSARGWLSTQVAELEREIEALRAAHEEERAHLNAQAACAPRRPPALPHGSPVRAPEVEELARQLGEVWRGAVRGYQERVAHMESSLGQARERLSQAVRGARESRLELQQLQADRDSLQERREALEQRLEGRWQDRLQATEKFQLAVEALEQEKQGIQSQIAQILEGGQQLAHLKMSLSLEVATYRTLLEAENSRLQTPGRSSQASLGFPDPKLKLHFLGIPEDQHLGSVLPVLSPTSFPSPLPNTLDTPATAFLKTQEFLQARTPTLASTPIPPMSEIPCPTNAEVRAQDAPLSLLQTQGGRQQAPEPLWAEATVPISTGVLPELEEPGGKGYFPDVPTSLTPPLNPHHPVLEAKDGESSESRVSSIFQEGEDQIWELAEKEAALEVKVENNLAQESQESGLDTKEILDSQGPLQKETLKALGEEPLLSLKIQSHETSGKENCNSSIEENLGTLKNTEKEKQSLKSLEEKNVEAEKTLENGLPELSMPLKKEDPRIEDQELMSPEGTLETVSFLGKENQEIVRSSEEGNLETLTTFKEESQYPLGCPEAEDQMLERLVEKGGRSFPGSPEEEDQQAFRPLQKENQEPLRCEETEDQMHERLIEKASQESLGSPEENQEAFRPLQKENQEPLRCEETEDQMHERLIEKASQESLGSPEENQEAFRPLEKENQEPLRFEEVEDQMHERLIEKESQESLESPEEDQEAFRPLEKENQESLRFEEAEDQTLERLIEKESQESLRSPEEEDQRIGKPLERENQESLRSLDENQETIVLLESKNQRPLRSLEVEEEEQRIVKPLEKMSQDSLKSLEKENAQPLRYLEEDDCMIQSLLDNKTHKSLGSLEDRNEENIIPPESETQASLRPPEEEEQRIVNCLEKESQEFLRSPEEENHGPLSSVEKEDQMVESQLEKESQDSGKSLEDVSQETFGSLENENPESLRSLAGDDQEDQKLEPETQQPLRAIEDGQAAASPPEKVDPELQKPLRNDQEIVRSLDKESQESPVSLKEEGMETVKSSETENIEPLETAEEDPERRKFIDTQEPLWSTQVTGEAIEPLEDEIQQPLGSVDENQETLTPLEKESQEPRSLDKGNLETVESPGGVEDSQQCLGVEEGLEREQHQESLRSLGEVEQELPGSGDHQRWEEVVEDRAAGQEAPLGTIGVETQDKAESHLRGQGGEEEAAEQGERLQGVMEEAWSLGSSEPKEQRVPAESLNNLEGQPEQMGALEVPVAQGVPEVTEQDEQRAQAGEQDCVEVTLGPEAASTGLELEQEVVGLEDPRHFTREEAIHPSLGEESVKAKIAQGLEGPGKEPKEAGALDSGILELPKTSSEALECEGPEESVEGWGEEEASLETSDQEGGDAPQPMPPETGDDEGVQAALTAPDPKLKEPCSPIPILTDAHELQLQAEEIQKAGWQPEAGPEALGRVEDEVEFGLGEEIPEGLPDWEEGREDSEADELGETLPDSTPLGLYLRSPASPKWDLAGEQRLSPQGEARKEGWGPVVLAAQGLSDPPEEEEEEQGHDSDLSSEEFEDLATEASLLPGVPKEVADHLGQAPPVLQPAGWDQGGESDGFADEEESGEEGEEEDVDEEGAESGAQWWGSGPSGGGVKVQDITQRGDLEQESAGVSGLWDDGLRGTAANVPVTTLEMASQDSAEPSESEGSESASLEGEEGQATDHLDAPQEVTSKVPGAGDTFDVSGQGPNSESEQVNGRVENGLGQPEGQVVLDADKDSLPLQEQEVGALKAPLVESPVHLGPSQFLKFTLSGVDGEPWSSEED